MSTSASTGGTRPEAAPEAAFENPASQCGSAIERTAACVAEFRALERKAMIAEAAYFRAERRGFVPGHELEDWLAAEFEVADRQQQDANVTYWD